MPEEYVDESVKPSASPVLLTLDSTSAKGLLVLLAVAVLERVKLDGPVIVLFRVVDATVFAVKTRADVTIQVDALPCVVVFVADSWLVECPAPVSREATPTSGDVATSVVVAVLSAPVTEP